MSIDSSESAGSELNIEKKAETLAADPLQAIKSHLLEQISNIQKAVEPLKDKTDASSLERKGITEAVNSLEAEIENKRKEVNALTELASSDLQKNIDDLKKKADALAFRSFLVDEVSFIEKILNSARVPWVHLWGHSQLNSLRSEIGTRKQKLASLEDGELPSFQQDLNKFKEASETLIIQPSLTTRLRSISALIWLSIIPLLILFYASWIAIWQRGHQTEIHATATYIASVMPSSTLPPAPSATPVVTFTPGP